MHPRTNELLSYIDDQFEHLHSTYESVPANQRGRRPSPTTWSADDVIGHLTMMEHRLAGIFSGLLTEARAGGLRAETDSSPVLSTIDVAPVLNRGTKLTAPDRVDPIKGGATHSWDEYQAAHVSLRNVLVENDGYALGDVSHPHPVFGPLAMYEWFAFAAAHSTRHAAQIREIADVVAAAPE